MSEVEAADGIPSPTPNGYPLYVSRCGRCQREHDVIPRQLRQPIIVGEARFTHWAMCPLNDEPILILIEGL